MKNRVMKNDYVNRNVSLDYLRVFALFCVLYYHFEIEFRSKGYWPLQESFSRFGNINLGGIGVFIFFMISGNVLSRQYNDSFNAKKFFYKRFLSIYPLFWITYLIAVIIEMFVFHNKFVGVEPWKLILTIIGCDGYIPQFNPTYYLVGEWFTPIIVSIYLLFPFICKGIHKYKKSYWIVLLLLDAIVLFNIWNPLGIVADGNLFIAITAFSFGIILQEESIKKYRLVYFSVPIWAGTLLLADKFPAVILNFILAFSTYIPFVGLSKYFKHRSIIFFLAKYSYGVYLTHHYVVRKVALYYNNLRQNVFSCGLIFVLVTVLYTVLIYFIYMSIKRHIKDIY